MQESPGEDLEAELDEMKRIAQKKDQELLAMRRAMESMRLRKKEVEEQLQAMKAEMLVLNGGPSTSLQAAETESPSPLPKSLSKSKLKLSKSYSNMF